MFNISEWVLLCVLELPLAWLAVSLFSFLTPAPTTTTHQDGLDDEDVHAGMISIYQWMLIITSQYLQSMPKMPEAEKKEESAESLAEKKEQVCYW